LKNMQVQSSMSLSIVIEGKLWGLIACHHTKPKSIPLALYKAYYLLSHIFSAQINQKEIFTNFKKFSELQLAREIFISTLNGKNRRTFYEALQEEIEKLQKIVLADECIVFEGSEAKVHNSQLSDEEITNIFKVAKQNQNSDSLFVTSNLISFLPDILEYSKVIGGILSLQIPIENKEVYLLFLKYEQITNTTWAGDPKKEVTYKNGQIVINPRASFESWKEVSRGTSSPINQIKIESAKLIVKELAHSFELFKVYDEARQIREENKTFQEQKLMAMGEMLGNIAHQWRQPLSVITTVASSIQMKYELGVFQIESLKEYMQQIISQSNYLSKTIDDFRNFLKNNDERQKITIKEVINRTLSIINPVLTNNQITLIDTFEDEDFIIEAHPNELIQAFVNIINNAKDAINQDTIVQEKKLIFITTSKNKDGLEICIKDNGGGISKKIMTRIFEPYFTTKHQSVGTGIGLSMTHKILTQRHNAKISIENIEYNYQDKLYKGACFTIFFPSK
ncbi:MAG: ATP-binding protein, partial [Arcobacteraceae bacterium]|nr:ATP-binding protein [Arcobacteraceae bacterium]